MTEEHEIRARALEIAHSGADPSADVRDILILAEQFAAYILAGNAAIPAANSP